MKKILGICLVIALFSGCTEEEEVSKSNQPQAAQTQVKTENKGTQTEAKTGKTEDKGIQTDSQGVLDPVKPSEDAEKLQNPPPAPPPPVKASATPAPVVKKVEPKKEEARKPDNGDLLSEIQKGKKLKHVEPETKKKPGGNPIGDAMKEALEKRRKAMEGNDSDSEK